MTNIISLEGTIQKSQLGVGTWALLSDRTYEIYKAQPKEMLQEGQRVRVTGRIRTDIMTIAMIGPVFEVESFEELG